MSQQVITLSHRPLLRSASLRSWTLPLFYFLVRLIIYITTMTNTTKNKKNALEHRPAQAPPAAAENERLTMEELLEKNAELERRLRKYKGISNLLV